MTEPGQTTRNLAESFASTVGWVPGESGSPGHFRPRRVTKYGERTDCSPTHLMIRTPTLSLSLRWDIVNPSWDVVIRGDIDGDYLRSIIGLTHDDAGWREIGGIIKHAIGRLQSNGMYLRINDAPKAKSRAQSTETKDHTTAEGSSRVGIGIIPDHLRSEAIESYQKSSRRRRR